MRSFYLTLFIFSASFAGGCRGGQATQVEERGRARVNPAPQASTMRKCKSDDLRIAGVEGSLQDIFAKRESPATGKRLGAEEPIQIVFTDAVDAALAQAAVVVRTVKTGGKECQSEEGAIPYLVEKGEPLNSLEFVPERPLHVGCEYEFVLLSKRLNERNMCLPDPFRMTFWVHEDASSTPSDSELTNDSSRVAKGINTPVATAMQRYRDAWLPSSADYSFQGPTEASLRKSLQEPRWEEEQWQLHYRGVALEQFRATVLSESGIFRGISLSWRPSELAQLSQRLNDTYTKPKITEDEALDRVLRELNVAEPHCWNEHPDRCERPKARLLLLVEKSLPVRLVWRFSKVNGSAVPRPLYRLAGATVHAMTGDVLYVHPGAIR